MVKIDVLSFCMFVAFQNLKLHFKLLNIYINITVCDTDSLSHKTEVVYVELLKLKHE